MDKPQNKSSENKVSGRRNFIKLTGLSLGSLGALSSLLRPSSAFAEAKGTKPAEGAKDAAKKPAAGALELVDPNDALPKGLGYVHDATKATRPDKAGTKGADQHCSNCQFYTKSGELSGGEVGKCQLFPKGVVKADGWCKSWIKKAG